MQQDWVSIARTSAEICVRDFLSASLTMGVMSPLSVATAIEMSTLGQGTISPWLASHCEFARGTSTSANATALTMKSLTET